MAEVPKRKWALWQEKKVLHYITAEYLRTPSVGVAEFWNWYNRDENNGELVAVVVLSPGQYVTLFDTGLPQ